MDLVRFLLVVGNIREHKEFNAHAHSTWQPKTYSPNGPTPTWLWAIRNTFQCPQLCSFSQPTADLDIKNWNLHHWNWPVNSYSHLKHFYRANITWYSFQGHWRSQCCIWISPKIASPWVGSLLDHYQGLRPDPGIETEIKKKLSWTFRNGVYSVRPDKNSTEGIQKPDMSGFRMFDLVRISNGIQILNGQPFIPT